MSDRFSPIITPLLTVVGVISLAVAIYFLRNILILLFLALILASAIYPVVRAAKRWKVPAPLTILSVYLLLFGVVSFLLSLVLPPLAQQTTQLIQSASTQLGLTSIPFDGFAHLDLTQWARSFDQYRGFFEQVTGSVQAMFQILMSTFSVLFIFFTLLVMTFHILMSMDHIALSYAWLLPGSRTEKRKMAKEIFHAVQIQLGSWVRGQVALMLVIGMMTYAGLLLLGIPYALPLALLAAALEIIPNLGPTIAAVPAVIVAFLMVNPLMGLFTIGFYLLVQQIENNLIVPLIMKEAVDVHPLTTILLMLIGFQVMGVIGAITIVPLYITIRTVSRTLWPNSGPFMHMGEEA